MTSELANFAARLREFISASNPVIADATQSTSEFQNGNGPLRLGGCEQDFNALARELFGLQFNANTAYRTHCEARRASPRTVRHWTRIPTVPTTAFKEFEMTCLPPAQRSRVFHSSGTTEQRPSRHFHNAESLAVYEASLRPWCSAQVQTNILLFKPLKMIQKEGFIKCREMGLILTPGTIDSLRAVTHLDVNDDDIENAANILDEVFN